jgi:hypothetical protein
VKIIQPPVTVLVKKLNSINRTKPYRPDDGAFSYQFLMTARSDSRFSFVCFNITAIKYRVMLTKFVNGVLYKKVFCKYITKNGKRIYPKKGGTFSFWVPVL